MSPTYIETKFNEYGRIIDFHAHPAIVPFIVNIHWFDVEWTNQNSTFWALKPGVSAPKTKANTTAH